MRGSTEVWARFESKGGPTDSKTMHGTVVEVLKEAARWVLDTKMHHNLVIGLAWNEAGLARAVAASPPSKQAAMDEFLGELDSLFDAADI